MAISLKNLHSAYFHWTVMKLDYKWILYATIPLNIHGLRDSDSQMILFLLGFIYCIAHIPL